MSKQYDPELQQRLEDYIKEVGSQSEAARRIGVSVAVVSTYRNSKYAGDVAGFETRLRQFLATKEAADELSNSVVEYVPTSISESVYHTIRICHLKGGLANECGDAGIGKTKAALKYVSDYPSQAILITANPCISSVTAFLKALCRRLKISAARKDDMGIEVDEHLRGGRKVLIVDEAQHLPIKTVEAIRALTDSNPELGCCMIGNPETINVGTRRPAFAQIRNRTKIVQIRHTGEITKADIALLFPALASQDKELELLWAVARSEQGVRGAVNLYSNAEDNEDISYQGMMSMAKYMKIVAY